MLVYCINILYIYLQDNKVLYFTTQQISSYWCGVMAHFWGPEALGFLGVACPCVHVWNLVKTRTPECMKGISSNYAEVSAVIWKWIDLDFGLHRSKDQIWAKIRLWSHYCAQLYQVATFFNEKDLFGPAKHFLNLRSKCQRSRSPDDQI